MAQPVILGECLRSTPAGRINASRMQEKGLAKNHSTVFLEETLTEVRKTTTWSKRRVQRTVNTSMLWERGPPGNGKAGKRTVQAAWCDDQGKVWGRRGPVCECCRATGCVAVAVTQQEVPLWRGEVTQPPDQPAEHPGFTWCSEHTQNSAHVGLSTLPATERGRRVRSFLCLSANSPAPLPPSR